MKASEQHQISINLKDPLVAAVLAWLVPGLGHIYQGRTAKGILFFVCLMGMFIWGCYLGGSPDLGWARVVYIAWQGEDKRLPFLCQVGMGLPTLPAWVQANRLRHGSPPLWDGFIAHSRRRAGQPYSRRSEPSTKQLFRAGNRLHDDCRPVEHPGDLRCLGWSSLPEENDNEEGEKSEEDDKKKADEPASVPHDKT